VIRRHAVLREGFRRGHRWARRGHPAPSATSARSLRWAQGLPPRRVCPLPQPLMTPQHRHFVRNIGTCIDGDKGGAPPSPRPLNGAGAPPVREEPATSRLTRRGHRCAMAATPGGGASGSTARS